MRRDLHIYTCGFLFHPDAGGKVLLVQKNRPDWQSGLLNGIGGGVKGGETPNAGMAREFREETGIDVNTWQRFCSERGTDYLVHFFRATLSGERPQTPAANDVGEMLAWYDVNKLKDHRVVGNLRWLVPMAQDWRRIVAEVATPSRIIDQPTW